ncbi:biotin--[acetyl-CoA-carboxylase] ligase [Macrococcus equipercicus]|uniref:Bifunctional ligase/repressor BirA n=1 Tax=Macrococcus equipercicus TaxID=69967 RepID=A0A9Q9F0D9_9STAP|nr:biotin--[acetyl-CoA-carboxylase] ligase [Macrococcus equipercicus]UTH12853.1 biotin--[acetyl-CoA-carboxylase] ligase [Macrococcus equipercicus]
MSKYKYKILSYLYDHKESYVSGQHIAEQLQISRTAVWKTIESLKDEGFVFDSVQNKGYKLVEFPDVWDNNLMQLMIRKSDYFSTIYVDHEVTSTQKVAHEKLLDNSEPFIVISEVQTAGRGRFNRVWDSQGKKGLWMSLVFNPHIPFAKIATFNLFISLAIAETMRDYGVNATVKWPNDIYINDRKVCGFLTEISGDSAGVHHIICGIGINLNHMPADFPEELQTTATSIALERGRTVNRYAFFEALYQQIERSYNQFMTLEFSDIKEQYKAYSNIWGRTLRYTEGKKQIFGEAVDIKDDGRLIVRDEAGNTHQFISADIEMQVD